jgi:DNA-binding Lrp family transcriptional regulator
METLDKYDVQILSELQADARLTTRTGAARGPVRPRPVGGRVRALEKAGFIKGYHGRDRPPTIGLACWPSCGWTRPQHWRATREMEEAIRRIPRSCSCHYISGAGTFELQVVSRDLDSLLARSRAKGLNNLHERKGPAHQLLARREVKASSSCRCRSSPRAVEAHAARAPTAAAAASGARPARRPPAPADEVVGAHGADDRAAGVLREHQPVQVQQRPGEASHTGVP